MRYYIIFFIFTIIFYNNLIFSQDTLKTYCEDYKSIPDSLSITLNNLDSTKDSIINISTSDDTNKFSPNINVTVEVKKISNVEIDVDGELNEKFGTLWKNLVILVKLIPAIIQNLR